MTVPPELVDLVDRFRRNLDVYTRHEYKEARARMEFSDPLTSCRITDQGG